MISIKWEEPPPDGRGLNRRESPRAEFADALRDRPGEWALYSDDIAVSTASQIKVGKYAAFQPAGAFEAISRGNGKRGRGRVYVRYVGEDGTAFAARSAA